MSMKLKIQHLMDATLVISQIIREQRPLPQKGNYRLARLHDKLNPEFLRINAERDTMIKAYDFHPMVPNPDYKAPLEGNDDTVIELVPKTIPSKDWAVPEDKLEEFRAKWEAFASDEIEVDVQPMPLEQLCFADPNVEASITGHEFIVLGSLVTE